MSLATLREDGPSPELECELLGGFALAPGTAADSVRLDGSAVSGTVARVPWARRAERIALVADGRVCVVAQDDVRIAPGSNLAGEERDTVTIERAPADVRGDLSAQALLLRAALIRVALMAGALERAAAIALEHAHERIQFGRPIGRFQAVQTHLVAIAQQAALVGIAADAAAARQGAFEIAAAKLLANRAAVTAGRAAHQVLGARGVTLEHPLSLETRRLWSWRTEHGDERHWSRRLGGAAVDAGAERLYPAITAGSAELQI